MPPKVCAGRSFFQLGKALNTAQTFAKDTLVVILPSRNPAKMTTLKDLAKNGVKISVENPHVPAGRTQDLFVRMF